MNTNVYYVEVDFDGVVTRRCIVPARFFKGTCPENRRIVVVEDEILPPTSTILDNSKITSSLLAVRSISELQPSILEQTRSVEARLAQKKILALQEVDKKYANKFTKIQGPFATLHAEKLRQAREGGGILIQDESDRLAILENAEKEQQKLADLESKRREIKAALRLVATEEDLNTVLKMYGIRLPRNKNRAENVLQVLKSL